MGTCGATQRSQLDATRQYRKDRSFEQIKKLDKVATQHAVMHLRNIVPALESELDNRFWHNPDGCHAYDAPLQTLVNTIREILSTYSEAENSTKYRFNEGKLKPFEAMRILEHYLNETQIIDPQKQGKVKTAGPSKQFKEHFDIMMKKTIEAEKAKAGGASMLLKSEQNGFHFQDLIHRSVWFMEADQDCGGTLDKKEIYKIMHSKSIGIAPQILERRITEADSNNDKKLDFGEYMKFYDALTFNRYAQKILFPTICGGYYCSDKEKDHKKEEERFKVCAQEGAKKGVLEAKEFRAFLQVEQGDDRASDDQQFEAFCRSLQKVGLGWFRQGQFVMTGYHFSEYLTYLPSMTFLSGRSTLCASTGEARVSQLHNSCLEPLATTVVYQDMKKPMTDYFIASSHNTYLMGHQLHGKSSVDAYINSLVLGCRCVELDCWDGKDGEPIITHGMTWTEETGFETCIKGIADYAFRASEFPVILSLEVHTSLPQQKRMGQIMKKYLVKGGHDGTNEKLNGIYPPIAYTDSKPSDPTFTPHGLRGYIIVKGKMLGKKDGDAFKQHLELVTALNEKMQTGLKGKTVDDVDDADEPEPEHDEEDDGAMSNEDKMKELEKNAKEFGKIKEEREKKAAAGTPESPVATSAPKKVSVDPELSSCVWMKSVHYRGHEKTIEKGNHWDVSSFTESKVDSFYGHDPQKYTLANQKVFSRVYPKGIRIDSKNYHPQAAWNMGCQVVALNYQIAYNKSKELRYNLGKFLDNGGCGYLVKPSYMRDGEDGSGFTDSCTLRVEIIQGYNLPKPKEDGRGTNKGEKIDPYVTASLNGVRPDDQKSYFRTKCIQDNGFNPEYFHCVPKFDMDTSEGALSQASQFKPEHVTRTKANADKGWIFQWEVKSLQMAILTLQVYDSDIDLDGDDFIGEAVIPLNVLRSGYRAVPLRDEDQFKLIEGAKLLCRFEVTNPRDGRRLSTAASLDNSPKHRAVAEPPGAGGADAAAPAPA